MKKLIAFSVIFALLTGAVFAFELGNFSAEFGFRVDLLDTGAGTNGQVTTAGTGGYWRTHDATTGVPLDPPVWVPATLNAVTRDAHAGGWEDGNGFYSPLQARFDVAYETSGGEAGISGGVRLEQTGSSLNGFGRGWWRPIDVLRVTLGNWNFARNFDGDTNNLWWDYGNDGENFASANFLAFEIGPIADLVTLKFSTMGDAIASTDIGDRYIKTFVAQAVINLGDMGTIGATFDYGTKYLIADYEATFSGFRVLGFFGYNTNTEAWGISAQVSTTIEGISLLARFNTTKFEAINIYAEASYEMTLAELDFGTIKITPKVDFAFNIKPDGTRLGWAVPITLTKTIEGFTFDTGVYLSGNTDFNNFNNIFRVRVPVRFVYKF